ncbi:unnamed protein product [Macrosiphum euphorbiae]|uniref:Uncharacterized protein n=1 Tax=Macrosiphum euphorbiae TaxID=13131 RepID=A0AAV0Y8K7_9HEMI|nr:unnamed protein product [Macrosiphum euphorbiae]
MIKILMIILQGIFLSAFAMPLIWEPESSTIVVPITQKPATAEQGQLTSPSKDFRVWNKWFTLTDSKSVRTVTEAPRLYSTCRGLSCRDMNLSKNRNVDDHHDKNRHGPNHQEMKQCGDNHYIYIDGILGQKRKSWRWSCLYLFLTIVVMVVLLIFFYYNFDLGFYSVNPERTELLSDN